MSAPLYSLFPPFPQGNSAEQTDTFFFPEHTLNKRGVHPPEIVLQEKEKNCPLLYFWEKKRLIASSFKGVPRVKIPV